eukprot:CAMPEP_0173211638 /NCGR_PEP_ID=MMETSP1141-20130122/24344_1 /TAXON_ID=483371 /ORGANISM="non described non described, Strain CCMP2298" /LENGTH=78 /DNA_ID=CAMNT_0014138545 /DNA_START=1588 /DNA_END=1821 /DNA_ORIENTATION=-
MSLWGLGPSPSSLLARAMGFALPRSSEGATEDIPGGFAGLVLPTWACVTCAWCCGCVCASLSGSSRSLPLLSPSRNPS